MARYRIIAQDGEGNALTVQDTETGTYIPADVGNRHWRQYLAWVAEGNEPDPLE